MYTTCPDCSSVYSITTEELGAAGGLVRCGNCDATFSAIRRLSAEAPQILTDHAPQSDASAKDSDASAGTSDHKTLPPDEAPGDAARGDETPGDETPGNDTRSESDETLSDDVGPAVDDHFDQEVANAIEQGAADDSSDETPIDHDATERVSGGDASESPGLDVGLTFEEPDDLAEKLIDEIDLLDEFDSQPDGFFEADLDIDGDDDLLSEFDEDEDLEFIDAEIEPDEDAATDTDAETDVGSAQSDSDDADGATSDEHNETDETAGSAQAMRDDTDAETPDEHYETDETAGSAQAKSDDTDGETSDEHKESDEATGFDQDAIDIANDSVDSSDVAKDAPENDEKSDHDVGQINDAEEDLAISDSAVASDPVDDENAGADVSGPDVGIESSDTSDDVQAPDDAALTTRILEDWDTDEGESDLEALLADDDFLAEEQADGGSDEYERDDSPSTEKESNTDSGESADLDDPESLTQSSDAVDHEADVREDGDTEVQDSDSEIEQDDSGVSDADATEEELAAQSDSDAESDDILTADVDGKFETDANDAHDYQDISQYLTPKKSLGRRIGETFLMLLLATLFGAQYVHHNRKELATHPQVGAYVQKIYTQIDLPLQPNWDVRDYRIARHTIVPQNDNQKVLLARATVINNSAHVRPAPLIRLELKNRWGDVVFARVFSAAEYLPDGTVAQMQGGARLEAVLDVLNPTDDGEIGYSFGICLNQADGRLNCGKDEIFRQ